MKIATPQDINAAVWKACDTFCGTVDATMYKDYVLAALFLKYISDVWNAHAEQYRIEFKGDVERIRRRLDRERFKLPDVSLPDNDGKGNRPLHRLVRPIV